MGIILDGKKIAEEIKTELRAEILELKQKGIIPGLAVILIGSDVASQVYVKNKERTCRELGIYSEVHHLKESISEEELLELIKQLNKKTEINGILVQLPLPESINEQKIILATNPKKDVDCFHPENIGKMFLGYPLFLPCTPAGVLEIMRQSKIDLSGKSVVTVGRSNIVGKPLAVMLLKENATVTMAHSKTRNLKDVTKQADILISATGQAGLIKADMVKKGAVVIDVGINRSADNKLLGDVDFENVKKVASAITPVPGGIGPMTIAMLMRNTVLAAKLQNGFQE